MKNEIKGDIAYIDLQGIDLLDNPVIDYDKFKKAFLICNMIVIGNFLIDGVKQPNIPVELEKDDDDYIIFYLTHYKVVIGDEEVTVTSVETPDQLKTDINAVSVLVGDSSVSSQITALVEGGTLSNAKPIYWHTIQFQRGGTAEEATAGRLIGQAIILNNSPDLITEAQFKNLLVIPGFYALVINGKASSLGKTDLTSMESELIGIKYKSDGTFSGALRDPSTNVISNVDYGWAVPFTYFADLGANKIN